MLVRFTGFVTDRVSVWTDFTERETEKEIMANDISEEEVRQALAEVKYPEIDRTLVELGMIRDVAVEGNRVMLTMAMPFPGISIKGLLVQSVREAVAKLGVEVEVKLTDVTQKERDTLLVMARQGWIG